MIDSAYEKRLFIGGHVDEQWLMVVDLPTVELPFDEMTDKLLEAANSQWALMIALWRRAGLRKTEVFNLQWSDVIWDQGRMRVPSPKTAHHDGRDERFVPIGDIIPQLNDSFELQMDNRLITQYTASNTNLDKPFKQIITNAGLTAWPKLFQNLERV